jgi:hypothetical protein
LGRLKGITLCGIVNSSRREAKLEPDLGFNAPNSWFIERRIRKPAKRSYCGYPAVVRQIAREEG